MLSFNFYPLAALPTIDSRGRLSNMAEQPSLNSNVRVFLPLDLDVAPACADTRKLGWSADYPDIGINHTLHNHLDLQPKIVLCHHSQCPKLFMK